MKIFFCFLLIATTTVAVAPGCANRCEQSAQNHCKRYSEAELKNMFGTNKDLSTALKECIDGRIQDKCVEKK